MTGRHRLFCGRWLLLIACAGDFAFSASAAVYYVAKTGDDNAAGTEEFPWATVQKAAYTLVAGDTVYVKAGTYPETVNVQHSGAPGAEIVFAAFPGDEVIIDGENVRPNTDTPRWGGLFEITGQSYIRVEGFRSINSAYAGFLTENGSHITFRNNSTFMTWSSGLSAWNSSHIIIDGNDVRRACQGDGPLQECISVSNTNTFEISNNHVYDRPYDTGGSGGGEGICSKDAARNGKVFNNHVHDLIKLGIYVDAWGSQLDGVDVYRNVVHDTYIGIALADEINSGYLRNVRVCNNIVYNNRLHGIEVSDATNGLAGGGDGPKQNILIANNTVVGNHPDPPVWGGGISITSANPNNSNLVVRNNICSQNGAWQILNVSVSVTIEYNLIDGPNDYVDESSSATNGDHSVTGLAEFVDAAAHDYHLSPTSPAIDAGARETSVPTDYDGNSRPANGTNEARGDGSDFDIGAFEYGALPTDIDETGQVDAVDVQLVINAALGLEVPQGSCDVNRDGGTDAVDVQLVINAALGIPV